MCIVSSNNYYTHSLDYGKNRHRTDTEIIAFGTGYVDLECADRRNT